MYTSGRYLVQFDPYTKRHYIKNIAKRHSDRQWRATQKSIEFVLEHIEQHILTDKAETIHVSDAGLVYSKEEICEPNETTKWQKIIDDQFPEIMRKFSGC